MATAVTSCAPSPLYTGHVKRLAPGGVPRDELGQPVFEDRRAKRSWLGLGKRKALPPPAPVRPAALPIIYYQDLRYSDRPADLAGAPQLPAR